MKRIFISTLIICTALALYGQSVHFGTTAVAGDDEFKSYYSEEGSTGAYFGASNSFPVNTVVAVTNPGNGKTVSVTIVKRLRQPGLFLVLSPEAGEALSFPENDVLDLQVVEKRKYSEVFSSYAEDRAFSNDPDINPSAELAEAPAPVEEIPEEEPLGELSEVVASADPVDEEESLPPEADINEYIPPVLMDGEGSTFDEGYDPLVLLEEGISEENITAEEDLPLPEEFSDRDLPDSFEPELPSEEGENREEPAEPLADEPALALESEELESDRFDTTVEDLLIFEPAEPEDGAPEGELAEAGVTEPSVGEIPLDERETIVMVPDLELEPEILIDDITNEPFVEVPEYEEETPAEIIAYVPDSDLASITGLDDSESSVIEPEEEVEDLTFEPGPVIIEEDFVELSDKKPEKKPEKEKAPIVVEDAIVPVPYEEELTMTTTTEEPEGNVIYFLTPGDFRPPPKSEEKIEKVEEQEEKTVEPKLVERTELEHLIVRDLRNGGSYLQLGVYSSVDVLYSTIKSINESYPAIVLTTGDGDSQMYKLLIGPITRDEKGIVMTRFRSQGYGDAFLYSPH